MSIRSLIAIENDDNTIESIYCHWGGAPENNGRILLEHFSSLEKLNELIALGSLSQISPRIRPAGKHSFDKPEKGTTVAHHRDRGDDWEETRPQTFTTLKEFLEEFGNRYWNIEFVFVFTKKGQWTFYSRDDNKPFQKKHALLTFLKKGKP
jgi:hypothetical protein